MIFDTSYSNKEITRKINKAVGLPFSWKERFKMAGIGSRRMVIHEISPEYKIYTNAEHYVSTANVELRPSGIIIHFRHKLQAYSWVMSFSSLNVIYEHFLRLESEGKYVQFNDPKNDRFISKLIQCQGSYN